MVQECERPVRVPMDALAPDVLRALLEEFVSRDGTDYGDRELSLEEKVERLRGEIARGEAHIVFDAESESVTVLPARELPG